MRKTQISIRVDPEVIARAEALVVKINRSGTQGFALRTRAEVLSLLLERALPILEAEWGVAPEEPGEELA